MTTRDYSMLGANAQRAVETGIATAEWYLTDIPRKEMKALLKRSNQPAMRDAIILFGCMILFAGIAIALMPSWWSVPFWLAYGVLYGSAMDSRWHECSHGTPFRTSWMNDALYHIASFCMIRNPVVWRWSHARHHTDTIIVGRDPEIIAMRPPKLMRILLNVFGILDGPISLKRMLVNAAGKLGAEEATFIPEQEKHKVYTVARIWMAIYVPVIIATIYFQSWIPLLLVGLPRMYGAWHHVMTGVLQHAGLAEDVLDHRMNSRTVYMNPISRFIYWNMNYHVEHHMFPMVPYHRLPELHEMMKHDTPAANPSILAGYAEAWPALKRQLRYEDYFVRRELPASAKPYREGPEMAALATPAK